MSEKWMPKDGETVWCFDCFGCVGAETYCSTYGEEQIDFGNCFSTKAEAQAAAEKVKALLLSLHSEPVTDCNQLPKLTAKVFDRPDCPDEATFAIVYQNGSAAFMRGNYYDIRPAGKGWEYSRSSGVYQLCEIPGNWDASDWQNSLVERPAKALPDWCKVGERFWHPEDMAGGRYLKITEIRGGGVYAKEKEDYDPDYLCFDLVRKYSKQARLRPYNADEMRGLAGKVLKHSTGCYLVTAFENRWDQVQVESVWRDENELVELWTTIDGSPCGILEHLENGGWVE